MHSKALIRAHLNTMCVLMQWGMSFRLNRLIFKEFQLTAKSREEKAFHQFHMYTEFLFSVELTRKTISQSIMQYL